MLYDLATTLLEAPFGNLSDRYGRRATLLAAALAGAAGAGALAFGDGFSLFAARQILLGASAALMSGTDSAFLFESLANRGRAEETERMELRAWRAMFAALMLSAVTGGLMAQIDPGLPFIAGAVAFATSLAIALRFVEPTDAEATSAEVGDSARARMLLNALSSRATLWLLALGVAMYAFSHVPFVFGQPLILAPLDEVELAAEAPAVSGAVTAAMMAISLAASLVAPNVRRWCGLVGVLLQAFGLQLALCGALAFANEGLGAALLLLRMIPDALSRPYFLAALQPLLPRAAPATILSLLGLAGRLVLSASLLIASEATSSGSSALTIRVRTSVTGLVPSSAFSSRNSAAEVRFARDQVSPPVFGVAAL